jgi:Putative esterase
MMRLGRAISAALLVALITACGGGGGGGSDTPTTAMPLGTTVMSSINSAQTGIAYTLDIWLPPDYATSTTSYPAVYATDCEYRFATLSGVLQQTGRNVILVNICAMSDARRWIDFTMPGAAAYYRFLTTELIPSIEANYRASSANRTFSGHSLSGEFAMLALFMEDPANRFFKSILSEECSCWYDASQNFSMLLPQPLALEQAMYDASNQLPINLIMAGDTLSNEPEVSFAYATMINRNFQGLRSTQPIYHLGHVPMDGPAFEDALNFIYGSP